MPAAACCQALFKEKEPLDVPFHCASVDVLHAYIVASDVRRGKYKKSKKYLCKK